MVTQKPKAKAKKTTPTEDFYLRRLAAERLSGPMPEGPRAYVFEDVHQGVAIPIARALSAATGLTFRVEHDMVDGAGPGEYIWRVRPQRELALPAWRCCRLIAISIRSLGALLPPDARR